VAYKMQIYVIRNKVNGKIYIGQTTQKVKDYFYRVCWNALNGETGRPFLYNAIRKYGIEAFEIEALAVMHSHKDLDYYEKSLISELRTQDRSIGYNLAAGGGGRSGMSAWNSGKKGLYSLETLRKMSEGQKRRVKQFGSPTKGRIVPIEQRKKISETLKARGIRPSVETCRLGGKSAIGESKRRWGNRNAAKKN